MEEEKKPSFIFSELDIKLINEHVRRISAPNLTMESNPCAFDWKIDFGNDNKQDFLFDDLCFRIPCVFFAYQSERF